MIKKVGLISFITFISLSLTAQVSTLDLTLQQAKEYALRHNRTMQNADLDVLKAEAVRWQTIASMLPQVNAAYDYNNFMDYVASFGGMQTTLPNQGTFSITAGLQISGSQIVGAMLNTIAVKMSDISKKQTKQTTVSNTTQLYMSALAMERTVELLDANKTNINRIYQMTQNAVNAGVMEKTDADKIYIQVLNIENSMNSAKRNLEVLYNSLKLFLGVDMDTQLLLTDDIDNLTDAETALSLIRTDFKPSDNYSYQLLQKNKELSKKQIALAAMGYSPSLTLGYKYSDVQYFGGAPLMSNTPPHVFAIGVSVPLFTSGRVHQSIAEKVIEHKKTLNTTLDAEEGLKMQDRQLKYNLSSTYESFQIQKQNSEVSQRVFDNISEKFKYGRASSLEVTQASTDMVSAQNGYIQALVNMVNAQIELRNLLNK
ncbi:MAG: TolC family protein [Prevotellaceae bacterium]|nr:TolC family protein [Prevotellaceae bacterium]